ESSSAPRAGRPAWSRNSRDRWAASCSHLLLVLMAKILDHRHRLAALVRDEIGERHGREIVVHLLVQRRPQVVRHATAFFMAAVLLAAALRGIERLVDRADDFRHCDRLRALAEV